MSNQIYHQCDTHNPLTDEEFGLPPTWNSDPLYNEEDEDGEIVEDEEDDCDNEDDDYCSDESSTTSTSSTNNQPDNTRVCDCCYCEVFGNGAAPVAPTSRNYNEMRERLRLRLSKRRAEKCERSTQQNGNVSKDDSANDRGGGIATNGSNGANQGNKSSAPVVDQRNLDELLNYINGTGQKDQEKSTSKKRDKNKNNNNNKKSNNKNNSHAKSAPKEDKDSEKCSNQNNGTTNHNHNNNNNNHHHHNHHHPNSTGGDASSNSSKRHQANNSNIHQQHQNSHGCASHQQNQIEHHQNNHKTSTTGNSKNTTPEAVKQNPTNLDHQHQQHDENYQPPQVTPTSSGKQKRKDRERTTNNKDQVSNKIQQNSPAKTISSPNGSLTGETCKSSLGTSHSSSTNAIKQETNTSNNQDCSVDIKTTTKSNNQSCHQNGTPPQTTKKELDDSYLPAPEDVFMPRDIDLNDEELDEMERELEAFKRFCFDSRPLVKKERVRVQLKDTNFFRELAERNTNGSSTSNQQHASSSRPLQMQMFRRKMSRV